MGRVLNDWGRLWPTVTQRTEVEIAGQLFEQSRKAFSKSVAQHGVVLQNHAYRHGIHVFVVVDQCWSFRKSRYAKHPDELLLVPFMGNFHERGRTARRKVITMIKCLIQYRARDGYLQWFRPVWLISDNVDSTPIQLNVMRLSSHP